ncbi:hypothetical protein AKJ52_00405 [candidate division MSBL1 archaeon SCGC-AAA382C18]|uniref:ABC transporter permease n=1 Tax=candidate division MSBL1 archaeon SCGC-AAA382C18 TaxID=1698281 RepID=A0A133VLR9_9EURY|nr:hypothetical protein AKJ52_00405 [candidate division MSBL1 archaeon SCGC-AAA382C18]
MQIRLLDNAIWIILAIVYGIFVMLNPGGMLSLSLIQFTIYSSLPLFFLAAAEGICIISGNFDLSVGQMTGFIAMSSAVIVTGDLGFSLPWYISIFVPILIGAAAGALNGSMVGFLNLNPFVVTLGTYMLFNGLTRVIRITTVYEGFPKYYVGLAGNFWSGLPIFLVLLGLLYFLLNHSSIGRQIYFSGSETQAAKMMGVKKRNLNFKVFLLSGILCGIGALFYTGYSGVVSVTLANETLFLAFAGAIIGGIGLKGGSGSILNIVGGVLLLSVILAGLAMLGGISAQMRQALYGIVVIFAVIFNLIRDQLRDRLIQRQ